MFGVLQGAGCIKPAERRQWMSHVCGLCLTLKDNYGQAARLCTNYDAALLSVLCQAQDAAPQEMRASRCPLRRSFRAETLASTNPGAQYAASLALLMAAAKIQDHVQDGEGFLRRAPRLANFVSRSWAKAVRETAQGLDFDTDLIEAQTQRQAQVEAQPRQEFAFYAQPTELAAAAAFCHTASVAQRPHNADPLYEMGRAFGRIVYLLDSYQDYAGDLAAGRFNALAACFAPEQVQEQAIRLFRQALRQLKRYFAQLDLPQPELARALLLRHLQHKAALLETPQDELHQSRRRRRKRRADIDDTCCDVCYCIHCCDGLDCCDCCECCDYDNDGDCDCGGCDCGDSDCGDCDCGGCDCGDCDCGDCDCGDCDCNCD